jgi:hypothetical protein
MNKLQQDIGRAARRCYSFDRKVYDRTRRAIGLGLGVGLEFTARPAQFDGRLSSLFGASTLQACQGNLGIVEGSTLKHTAGSGPILGLTGTRTSATPTSISITTTGSGALGVWTGLATYRDSSTQPFTSASTVPLTGLAAGLTLTIGAGTAVAATDTWSATAASWQDQTTAVKHYTQVAAAQQPIITPGYGGWCGLLFDSVDDWMACAVLAGITTPSVSPLYAWLIYRVITWTGGLVVYGDASAFNTAYILMSSASPNVQASNDGTNFAASNALPVGTFGVVEAYFSNTTADFLQAGSGAAVTGTALGNTNINGRALAAVANIAFANVEYLGVVHTLGLPSAAARAAARANIKALLGSSLAA